VDLVSQAPAHDRSASLELVDGQVHPRPDERAQRAFHAVLRHKPLQVSQFAARVVEERSIGAARMAVDGRSGESEELLLAALLAAS
jgi:hypothetical protein